MSNDKTIQTVFKFMVLLFVLRFAGYIFPTARLWGVNHLIFLPGWFAVAYAVAGVLVLAAYYIRPVQKIGEIAVERFDYFFFEHKRQVVNRIVRALVAGVVFGIFVMPTHFLGDGYMQINNIGANQFVIHKWSEQGITNVTLLLQSLLGDRSVANAQLSFQIVSVVSGIIVMYFFLLMARELGKDKVRRFLGLAVLTFSGVSLLFFGYAESYPLLWVGIAGFFYFSLRYINTGRDLWRAVLLFVLGAFVHLYMFVFGPALIGLAFSREKGKKLYAKFKIPFWVIVGASAIAAVVLLFLKIQSNLFIENIFLWPFSGKPIDEDYFIFSTSHLLDILNLSFILSPYLILLVLLVGNEWKLFFKKPYSYFLILSSIGSLLFLFVVDPQLTMARDWDLMSPSFLALTVLTLMLIPPNRLRVLSGRVLPMTGMAALLVLPYIVTDLSEASSVRYIKYIINLDRSKSISSFIVLCTYYEYHGDQHAADSLNYLYPKYYPDAVKLRGALEALQAWDGETARSYLASIKPNKFLSGYHNLKGGVYYMSGEYSKALEESNRALQLEPNNGLTLCDRGIIFTGLKKLDSAKYWFEASYRLSASNPFVVSSLAWLYYQAQNYDSSTYFARHLLALGPDGSSGNYWLAKIAVRKLKFGDFSGYFEAYKKDGPSDPSYQSRLEELQKVADALKDSLHP